MARTRMTFTQLLLQEVRQHLASMAADPRCQHSHRDAFYAAAREIGRATPRLVSEARRKLDWQDALTQQEESSHGR